MLLTLYSLVYQTSDAPAAVFGGPVGDVWITLAVGDSVSVRLVVDSDVVYVATLAGATTGDLSLATDVSTQRAMTGEVVI